MRKKRKSRATGKRSSRRHAHCPVCGTVRPLDPPSSSPFNMVMMGEHKLEELVQHFAGKGCITWTRRDKSRDPEWIAWLLEILEKVHHDLALRLEGLTGEPEEELVWQKERSVPPLAVEREFPPMAVEYDFAKIRKQGKPSSSKTARALRATSSASWKRPAKGGSSSGSRPPLKKSPPVVNVEIEVGKPKITIEGKDR